MKMPPQSWCHGRVPRIEVLVCARTSFAHSRPQILCKDCLPFENRAYSYQSRRRPLHRVSTCASQQTVLSIIKGSGMLCAEHIPSLQREMKQGLTPNGT